MPPTFTYTVDTVEQTTGEHELTARQILERAGIDPTQRYLIELKGNAQESYKDRLDVPIHIHQKQEFVTASLGPVPVS